METLQSLKESLRRREEEKQRHAAYKEKKRALGPPPTKLEDFGTTGDGIGGMSTGRTSRQSGRVSGMSSGSEHGGGTAPVAPNLLQSLNRLVELEKRITKLEDMDGYDAGATPRSGRDSTDAAARALRGKAMTFTKKRTVAAPGAPAKTVFAVKLVDKAVVASRKKLAAPSAASRTAAQSRSWLADRKATQAARRQRMEADYSSGRAGSRATSGSSSWIGNRGSQGRLGVSAPARVGSRPAVAARQLQASRVAPGGPVMGSRKLVGRGATQMNSFHEMRQQFEARKAATRQAAAASRTAPVPSRTAPRAASGSTRASAAGSYKGSSTSTAASRRQVYFCVALRAMCCQAAGCPFRACLCRCNEADACCMLQAPVKTAWGGSQARPAVRR